ncbi:MAG: glycoside hydrolase family 3 C-terminal domain-containing protein [Kiritimatiellia bacterium]
MQNNTEDSTSRAYAFARELVAKMTTEEKLGQMRNATDAIPRLGIPKGRWSCECLHGLARAGRATVFPQALGLASTFDVALMGKIGDVIATETRAKYNLEMRETGACDSVGLVALSPNINLFRDPRWGRGQETYGEDSHLTACMGVAYIRGLAGTHPRRLKMGAGPKHFVAHSGPDQERHRWNLELDEKELRESYMPHFAACVAEPGTVNIMGAYNRLNGEACCAHTHLLEEVLRVEWGFDGFVISDGGALVDLWAYHGLAKDPAEAAAKGLNKGCDINLGHTFLELPEAMKRGLVEETDLDRALIRAFSVKARLGLLEDGEGDPFAGISEEVIDCQEHRDLSRQAARESMVLLKNQDALLPLDRHKVRSVAVVGPGASSVFAMLGNYYGTSGNLCSILEGISGAVSPLTRVNAEVGCYPSMGDPRLLRAAANTAKSASVVVVCAGLFSEIEGESYDGPLADCMGDRVKLALPDVQQELIRACAAAGKPVILLLHGCAPLDLRGIEDKVQAILHVGYPGCEGGRAVADLLFGDANPSGRLPVTWVESEEQLPPFTDYRMTERGYRYSRKKVLYPFGYGLSYTRFAYADLQAPERVRIGETFAFSCRVTNTGECAGREVPQVYLSDEEATCRVPQRALAAFASVDLAPGETATCHFKISARQMAVILDDGRCRVEPGVFRFTVGGCQGDARSRELMQRPVLEGRFEVVGEALMLPYAFQLDAEYVPEASRKTARPETFNSRLNLDGVNG